MDFIDKLRVFAAVADQQSFARAAESLDIYRARVTTAVSELEKEVGARLFHRTTRKTTLTREGTAFYDQARATLTAVGDARNFFDGGSATPRGRIRVDMSNAVARSTIIPRLLEFKAAYPEIDVVLGVSDQQVDLIAEGVDCVLRLGPLGTSSMVGRTLRNVPNVTCASPDYVARHGRPRNLDELKQHGGVVYYTGKDRRTRDWLYLVDGVVTPVRMTPAVMVNDHEAYVSCAVNGVGIAQIPSIGIERELAEGSLVPLLDPAIEGDILLSLLYPARKHLPLQVRAFMDWAMAVLADKPTPGLRS